MKYVWLHTDCLKLLQGMKDESVDFIFTSPPYGIGKEYESKDLQATLDFHSKIIKECIRVVKKTGSICWQVGNFVDKGSIYPLDIHAYQQFSPKMKLRNRIIWNFSHGLHCKNRLSGRYETVLWFTKSDKYYFNLHPLRTPSKYSKKRKNKKISSNPYGKNPGDVWMIQNIKHNHPEKIKGGHPCQTPTHLVIQLIEALCPPDGIVFDPFGGVGTTLVSAMKTKREVISCEKNKKYYKLGLKRIQAFKKSKLKFHTQPLPIDRVHIKRIISEIYAVIKESEKHAKDCHDRFFDGFAEGFLECALELEELLRKEKYHYTYDALAWQYVEENKLQDVVKQQEAILKKQLAKDRMRY